MTIRITSHKKKKLETIWFVFGKYGSKSEDDIDVFFRALLSGKDKRQHFELEKDLLKQVDKVIYDN
jgi:hypothetical protein